MVPILLSQHYSPLICLEGKLFILVRGSTVSGTSCHLRRMVALRADLPGLAACWKGLCCLWAWCVFLVHKYYLHFCVPGKGHPGLG